MKPSFRNLARPVATAALLIVGVAGAAVLPDDRADVFYSDYKGGGMDIKGESFLVRKKFSEQFAVEANYFIDKVSGASVDVLSQASVIKDERKQKSISLDYIHNKTQYNLSYTNSTERDYISNTTHFSLSQDMFGDLTTVTLGFTDSRNKVGENNGTAFAPKIEWKGTAYSRSFLAGVSQVVTKNLISGVTLEVITDRGLLSNPYRMIRFVDNAPGNALGYGLGQQIYPNTHTSTAVEGHLEGPSAHSRAGIHPTHIQSMDSRGAAALLHPESRLVLQRLVPFRELAELRSARPESSLHDQLHTRLEGDLCLPARWLEDIQARYRNRGREPNSFQIQ
jgi:Protein of unknown function (DUF3570)